MHPSSEKSQVIRPFDQRKDRTSRSRVGRSSHPTTLPVGARSSPLSRRQVQEVFEALKAYWPTIQFDPIWVETTGDKNKTISLRNLEKTDFFTKEVDELLVSRQVRLTIHSAKDLPELLPPWITIGAITQGLDARDALVYKDALRPNCLIATSSERREVAVRRLFPKARFIDLRGTIGERLALLEQGKVDGVVVAEAALLRLGLQTLQRVYLPGLTVQGQGQLAVLCRNDDEEMKTLLKCIDARKEPVVLYVGLDPVRYACKGKLIHHPVIQTVPLPSLPEEIYNTPFTHLLLTSPTAVRHWFSLFSDSHSEIFVLALGSGTAETLHQHGVIPSAIAPFPTQEGVIALLKRLPLEKAFLLWPRSARARPLLEAYLQEQKISHRILDLYQTIPNKTLPKPDFSCLDEIVFTSPSTVHAFLALYGSFPPGVKRTPIGPLTAQALAQIGPIPYDSLETTRRSFV